MGTIHHHAIIVTSDNVEALSSAHAAALALGLTVSEPVASGINGYHSFFIPPDGSKEGWAESDVGNERRRNWVKWTQVWHNADGSSPLEWTMVRYGRDLRRTLLEEDEWTTTRYLRE